MKFFTRNGVIHPVNHNYYTDSHKRVMPLEKAKKIGHEFIDDTRGAYSRVEFVGSVRRGEAEARDIDLVAIPKDDWTAEERASFVDRVEKHGGKITESGPKLVTADFEGAQINVWFTDRDEWGAETAARLGPREHDIALRIAAKKKGWTLNEHGLFDARGHRVPDTKTAGEIFDKLGHTKEECDTRKEAGF